MLRKGVSVLAIGMLLVLGAPEAFSAEKVSSYHGHKSRHNSHSHHMQTHTTVKAHPLTPTQKIALKIKSFKPGDRQSEARHFDFENYSFKTLDDAARRLFPSGTKLSYVDDVLKKRGKAARSQATRNGLVRYDYRFHFDRFACARTVLVSFDNKTKRVTSARGDGQCN